VRKAFKEPSALKAYRVL
jgi:hypothetical protein